MTQMTVAAGLLVMGAAGHAQTWWNADYAKRIPVTITNPTGGLQPTANQTAEVLVDPLPADARKDFQDIRVVYWNGTTSQQLDRQIIREAATAVFENTSVGKTDYASLPTGTKLASLTGQDDAATVITLPFSFPFQGTTSNKLTVATDGYVKPGEVEYNPRPDSAANATNINAIIPFSSDLAVTDAAAGVWADTSDPTKVTIRWEVNESASGPVIAKFAVVLYPNGDVRFVYGTPASSPSTGIAGPSGYWPVVYGVGVSSPASIIHAPTFPVDFANHNDILFTQNLTGNNTSARVVFRLVTPLAEGASSTGQYFIYYGNPSPALDVPNNIKNIYDYVVDSEGETVGQPAADWLPLRTGTATTEVVNGIPSAVLRNSTSGVSHPRYIIKDGVMPSFLNAELFARFTPLGGENEIVPLLRVQNTGDTTARTYGGGVGYASDGWGSQQGLASTINPDIDQGPLDFAGLTPVNGANPTGVIENVLFRYEGQLLWGKKWSQFQDEPLWVRAAVDRTKFDLARGGVAEPIYDQPGVTGIASYSTSLAVHQIALRELITESTTAAATANTATGPFIQGTISSTNATLNPLSGATVHITGPGGFDQTYAVGPNGQYRISLPAGSGPYTVTASYAYHTDGTASVSPTASGLTNLTLTYVGVKVTGLVRDALTNLRLSGATVIGVNAAGHRVNATTTNAQGEYTLLLPTGGTYRVGAVTASGLGDDKVITAASATDATVNLAVHVVANGNMELPGAGETAPEGWTTQEFTPASPAGAYLYTQDQNRTPGGKWSLAVRDPGETSAWNPPNGYELPVLNSTFGVTVSVWVYFSAPGQMAALRLRDNFPTTGSTVAGRIQVVAGAANDPGNENQSVATVPVGQWFELRKTAPAGTVLANDGNLGMNLYARGVAAGAAAGTVYFDDLTITQAPVGMVKGKVVTSAGVPVPDAYVGRYIEAGIFETPTFFSGPFTTTDEQGNFTLYSAVAGPVSVAAWQVPPHSTTLLPDYGYLATPVTATAGENPPPITITLQAATNVADGATVSAKDTGNTRDVTGNLANAVDNNIGTRWDSYGGATGLTKDQIIVFDLKSPQTVDQLEIWWEAAVPTQYRVYVGPDLTNMTLVFQNPDDVNSNTMGILANLTPFNEGGLHITHLPDDAKTNVRYIRIETIDWNFQNYSITELRALSSTVPLPVTLEDAAAILRFWGGLSAATPADVTRLDKNGSNSLTIEDAVALAKSLQ